jgi:3-oxoacyl-[acyl-carrier protein] reductase
VRAADVAAKHGVVGLTKAMAVELGSQGVTVNCICPGPIRTGMTAAIPERAKEQYAKRLSPVRRYAEAEEVAQVTASVCLPASSYLNGCIINVDGGLLANNALLPFRLPWTDADGNP